MTSVAAAATSAPTTPAAATTQGPPTSAGVGGLPAAANGAGADDEDDDGIETVLTDGWVDHDDDPELGGEFPPPAAAQVSGDGGAAVAAAAAGGSSVGLGGDGVGTMATTDADSKDDDVAAALVSTEAIDEAVKACVSVNMEHVVNLLQTHTAHALLQQGLHFGSGNATHNLTWILVGWDNSPGPFSSQR